MSYTLHSYHGDIKYAYLINSFKKYIHCGWTRAIYFSTSDEKDKTQKSFYSDVYSSVNFSPPKDQIGSALGCDQYTLMNSIL